MDEKNQIQKRRKSHTFYVRLGRKLVLGAVIGVVGMLMLGLTSKPPSNLGVRNGRLAQLPDSPNCVSTQTDQPKKRMSALEMPDSTVEAMSRIEKAVLSMPRANIVTSRDDYLHAEFVSLCFRFVDDVEFFIDDNEKVIHFRSASRVGYYDLGVNRRRMNKLSERINNE